MLFRSNVPASCSLCRRAVCINDREMLCDKRGVVSASYSCRKFIYDPLKREPEQKPKLGTDYDFSLD